MRVLHLLDHRDVIQLDVEVLVDALERAADLYVVLELDRDLRVDQGLEEAAGMDVVSCVVSLSGRLWSLLRLDAAPRAAAG